MPDTPTGWREKAVRNLEDEVATVSELSARYHLLAVRAPRISVGRDGIQHPRRQLESLSVQYARMKDYYEKFAVQLSQGAVLR